MNGIPEVPMLEDVQNANPIISTVKRCTKCLTEKLINEFYRNTNSCKVCYIAASAKWAKNNLEKRHKIDLKCYYKNPEKHRKWAREHPEIMKASHQKWRKANPIKKSSKSYLNCCIRAVVAFSIKGNKNGRSWEKLVGYSLEDLRRHIEKHFSPGMSWNNYGKWHIDHIIPKSAFNFLYPEDIDFEKCWALKNLQPLWAKDNLSKHNKLSKPFQPSLRLRGATPWGEKER